MSVSPSLSERQTQAKQDLFNAVSMAKCCLDLGTDKSFWNVSINQKVPMLKILQFRDFREIFFSLSICEKEIDFFFLFF